MEKGKAPVGAAHNKDTENQSKTQISGASFSCFGSAQIADVIHEEIVKAPEPRWAKYEYDYGQPLPPAPPTLISIYGADVAFRGGITTISGADKAGKSTLVRLILAAAISGVPVFGVEVKMAKVVHFDTEQPDDRLGRLYENAFHLADMKRHVIPDAVRTFKIRTLSPDERRRAVLETIEDIAPDIVILDGVADLIPDINDLAASTALIADLLTIATDNNIAFVCIIHTNPSDAAGKLRGHLGSELMRKCETSITMEKSDSGVFTCRCKASRGRPFDAFSFTKDEGDHLVPVDAPIKAIGAPDILLQAMEPGRAYTHTELVALVTSQGVTTSSAKYAVNKNLKSGWLVKNDRKYELKADA